MQPDSGLLPLSPPSPSFWQGKPKENRVYSPSASTWRWPCWPSSQTAIAASRYWTCWMYRAPGRPCNPGHGPVAVPLCERWGTTCILASSLWLNQDVTFVKSTLDTLSKTYYASSSGKNGIKGDQPGPAELDQREQTGGLLQEAGSGGTGAECRNGSCPGHDGNLQAKWASEFSPSATEPGLFHGLPRISPE